MNNVRPDRTASYVELNPEPPPLTSRGRGWEGIIVERDLFLPFDNGEVAYEEHFLGFVRSDQVHLSFSVEGRRCEGLYNNDDYFLCPGQQPVHWKLDDACQCLIVMIRPEVVGRVAQEVAGADPSKVHLLEQPKMRDPLLRQIGLTLMAELEGGGLGERLYVDSLLNSLALHLLRSYSSLVKRFEQPTDRGLTAAKLKKAIEAINDHLEVGISLSDLAGAAGVSTSHFEVLFRRSTGMSPHKYLLHRRVQRAKDLLRREDLSLAQIAARTGFCDQSHLTRHFVRIVGVSPGRYRKDS